MLTIVLFTGCIDLSQPMAVPEAVPEPVSASPEPVPDPDPDALASLSGRRIWMVNASAEACASATALGLGVTCEPDRPGAMREEIVCWCPTISRQALSALQNTLSVSDFAVRSWAEQPEESDPEECGSFAEITIRY